MTVTVEVNATWRLSQVMFSMMTGVPGSIQGQSEFLLQPAPNPDPDAAIFQRQGTANYGSMPGDPIYRPLDSKTLAETVMLDDVEWSLAEVMQALNLFFERWRAEDAAKPPTPSPVP